MPKKSPKQLQHANEIAELRSRLEESEETLRAIRQNMVDSFVVINADEVKVLTLNEAEIRYRMIVECMNEGIVTLIPDGTIFYCNPRFAEMVQIKDEKLIGMRFQELILPEEQSAFASFSTREGTDKGSERFCLKLQNGDCFHVQISAYQLGTADSTGLSFVVSDIRPQVEAEEALRNREGIFRIIATNSPDVIFSQDRDLRYTWILNPAEPLSVDQVIGKTDWDLLPLEQAQRTTAIKQIILKTGESHHEIIRLSPGGKTRWYDAIYQPTFDEAQHITGLICYARDITRLVQAEQQVRALASRLTLAEQEERHRISQILHDDLQQRLFTIKAQMAFMYDESKKDQISVDIRKELEQIQGSLSEVIAVSRNLSIDLSPVVTQGEGLADAMDWLAFRMHEQFRLQVTLHVKEDFGELDHSMRILLFQAIRELLFNVVKHAGVLEATVVLEQSSGQGRITVSDHGKGFDGDSVTKDVRMAHGLLVVQDRLSLLGCKMEIQSKLGEGTRIIIDIPLEKVTT